MSTRVETTQDPKWRRLPEERPRQILDAALAVFAEHGIAAARLEEIASRAGVSKGTIYLYFHSKEDLFREVVRLLVVPLIARGDDLLAGGTATQELTSYISHQWRVFDLPESEGWVRLVLLELHKYPDLAAFYRTEVIERSNQVLGDIVRHGIASGEFRALDPECAVRMIKAVILMHVLWSGTFSQTIQLRAKPRDVVLQEITEFVVHALCATGDRNPASGSGARSA
ncbi:MAG: TetR/AcrR family transcriptional regulator [Gemmatimonadales bacterium]